MTSGLLKFKSEYSRDQQDENGNWYAVVKMESTTKLFLKKT